MKITQSSTNLSLKDWQADLRQLVSIVTTEQVLRQNFKTEMLNGEIIKQQ